MSLSICELPPNAQRPSAVPSVVALMVWNGNDPLPTESGLAHWSLGGARTGAVQEWLSRQAAICALACAPKLVRLPEQPLMAEHMMPQSGVPSQCCALQPWPISCAVSAFRDARLVV